jgi:uncharacterized protein (UPF0332 family)
MDDGIVDDEYSDIIREAFDYRSDSDYDDFYVITSRRKKLFLWIKCIQG